MTKRTIPGRRERKAHLLVQNPVTSPRFLSFFTKMGHLSIKQIDEGEVFAGFYFIKDSRMNVAVDQLTVK
jgi:hypothetical protein